MASTPQTLDFLLDQLAGEPVTARKMFGEYCLYYAEKPVALLCDDQLYLKPTEPGRALLATPQEAPPYPGAKPHLLVTADHWEDRDWLLQLLQVTARALPPPKKRKPRAQANNRNE